MKVIVKRTADPRRGWEVVPVSADPSVSLIERQTFSSRKEARLYASIRNRVNTFAEASREFANT